MAKTTNTKNTKRKGGEFGVGIGGHAIKKTTRVDNKKQKAAVEKFIITSKKAKEVVAVGDDVEVCRSGEVYMGRVLEKGSAGYLIHYKGWKKTHDEWVDQIKDASEKENNQEAVDKVEATPKAAKNFSIFKKTSDSKNATPKTPRLFSIFEKNASTGLELMNNSTQDSCNSTPSSKKSSFTKVINSQRKINLENDDLSEYEKIRLANIKEREQLFARLAISEAKDSLKQVLTPISVNKLAASNRGLKSEKKLKDEVPTPRRQSKRILGLSWKNDEEKIEAEPEPVEEYPRLRLENISCQETYRGKESEASKLFLSTILSKESSSSAENGDSLSQSLDNLSINQNRVAKVVPGRIFSLAVHPGGGKLLAAAGGKSGGVGLWDVEDVDSPTQGVHLYEPHSRPVNCLNWNKLNDKQLVSTSYDGTVRALDVEKQEHILLYADQEDNYTSLHCQTGPDTFLVAVSSGEIVVVDSRVDNLAPVHTYKVFDRLVAKALDIHPLHLNYFLCCNNKGFCGVFDTRGGGKAGKMMTPVCKLEGHTRALSSAMFSPVSGGKIASLSYDDHLRLYNSCSMSGEILPISTVKHNNHTGRWLTPFKLHWRQGREDVLLTGSMERPRQMEVWRVEEEDVKMEKVLRGEELGSVCSVVAMHSTKSVVVGGNSSGRLYVFM